MRSNLAWSALCALLTACSGTAQDSPVSVSVTIEGQGRVYAPAASMACEESCQFTAPGVSPVTLHAVPDRGAAFGGWSGSCQGEDSTCTVATGDSVSVSATFRTICPDPWRTSTSGQIVAMDAHPSGWIATTGDTTAVYDVFTCRAVWSSGAKGTSVRFDRLGNVAVANGPALSLLSGANGTPLWQTMVDGEIAAMDTTANDRIIAAGTGRDSGQLWKIRGRDGRAEDTVGLQDATVIEVIVHAEQVWVAGHGDGEPFVQSYLADSLELTGALAMQDLDEVTGLSILPDGGQAVAGVYNGTNIALTFGLSGAESGRVSLPAMPLLLGSYAITEEVLDLAQGEVIATLPAAPQAGAASSMFLYLANPQQLSRLPWGPE